MKLQTKRALIIVSSSVVVFSSIFFLTLTLTNLVHSSKNSNSISMKKNSSNKTIDENTLKNNELNISEGNDAVSANPEKYSDYIVKDGDTLYSIARTSMPWKNQEDAVKTLQIMNSIKDRESIMVGSHLMIPINDINQTGCTKHIVSKGENLSTIAKEYLPKLNSDDAIKIIMKKNKLTDSSVLSTGLELYIPNSETVAANSNDVKDNSTK